MRWEDRQAGRKEGEMPLLSMPLSGAFWRVFVDRPTIVYFLVHSDGEHRFRDAVSLTEVSRVFPHGLTQLRFCPVIPGVTELDIPAPGEGIIVLGRPGLFQSQFLDDRILATLNPPLQLHFLSNNPKERGYRTVCCRLTNHEYNVPDGHETLTDSHLEDFGQVYLGRAQVYESEEPSPCLILAGASTLGTWGASVFATSPYLLERHVGYSPWFQGVLSVALRRSTPGSLYLRPNLAVQVTESFFRACWLKVVYKGRAKGREWRQNQDFDLFINDNHVTSGFDNWRCFLSLALEQQERPGQDIKVSEIKARLEQAFSPPSLSTTDFNVHARMQEVSNQIRRHRVFIERTGTGYRLLLAGFEEAIIEEAPVNRGAVSRRATPRKTPTFSKGGSV